LRNGKVAKPDFDTGIIANISSCDKFGIELFSRVSTTNRALYCKLDNAFDEKSVSLNKKYVFVNKYKLLLVTYDNIHFVNYFVP
jgi:hypothetical protein